MNFCSAAQSSQAKDRGQGSSQRSAMLSASASGCASTPEGRDLKGPAPRAVQGCAAPDVREFRSSLCHLRSTRCALQLKG